MNPSQLPTQQPVPKKKRPAPTKLRTPKMSSVLAFACAMFIALGGFLAVKGGTLSTSATGQTTIQSAAAQQDDNDYGAEQDDSGYNTSVTQSQQTQAPPVPAPTTQSS